MNIERRNFDSGALELRGADGLKIGGHAAVFNDQVEIWPGFEERFEPGAFAETIKDDDIRALWNHDPAFVMGRNKAGTLRLGEDKRGLTFENDPPDAQWARDVVTSIERGDITGASIGFRSIDEEFEKKDGVEVRTITRAKLFDVSPVAFPAYPSTDVAVRAVLECSPGLPDELRDELARVLLGNPNVDRAAENIQAALTAALDTHTEALATRVAEIIQEQRAVDRAALDMRRRHLDVAAL